MMENESWNDVDYIDEEVLVQNKKSKDRGRKRKWREIENIKEQRRLRRDLQEYEYSYL